MRFKFKKVLNVLCPKWTNADLFKTRGREIEKTEEKEIIFKPHEIKWKSLFHREHVPT